MAGSWGHRTQQGRPSAGGFRAPVSGWGSDRPSARGLRAAGTTPRHRQAGRPSAGWRQDPPGAGSREPGAGSREPGAGSREPGARPVRSGRQAVRRS
ncbi:annexin Max4 [Streptomyces sp. P3]|nr:annexin Max4 [Streptomyces sp. P3]